MKNPFYFFLFFPLIAFNQSTNFNYPVPSQEHGIAIDTARIYDSLAVHLDSLQNHNLRLIAIIDSLSMINDSLNIHNDRLIDLLINLSLKLNVSNPWFTGTLSGPDLDISQNIYADSSIVPGIKANGNSSTAITIYLTQGNTHKITRTGSTTVTMIGAVEGGTYSIKFTHENSANAYTVAFSPTVTWPSGTSPAWTNTANAVDWVSLRYSDGTFYGMQIPDFK